MFVFWNLFFEKLFFKFFYIYLSLEKLINKKYFLISKYSCVRFTSLNTIHILIATILLKPIKFETLLQLDGSNYLIYVAKIDSQHYPDMESIFYSMDDFSTFLCQDAIEELITLMTGLVMPILIK